MRLSTPHRSRSIGSTTLFLALALLPAAGRSDEPDAALAGEPAAADIIARADRVRNPEVGFRLTNTLVEYSAGQERDRAVLTIYAREDKASRAYSDLVRYVEPQRDAGKLVLYNGANMWFYDPSSKSSVRISPQQRLLGQASEGDVVIANLSRDYKTTLSSVEHLQDADRQDRDCWHLELAPNGSDAMYGRVEYWVERGTFRPIKGKFYADSGRLLKIAYYHRYSSQLGELRPAETIIIDAVDTKLVTTMTMSDYRAQEIPEAWFQRDYLPRVTAE
jgi:hypothetical protein